MSRHPPAIIIIILLLTLSLFFFHSTKSPSYEVSPFEIPSLVLCCLHNILLVNASTHCYNGKTLNIYFKCSIVSHSVWAVKFTMWLTYLWWLANSTVNINDFNEHIIIYLGPIIWKSLDLRFAATWYISHHLSSSHNRASWDTLDSYIISIPQPDPEQFNFSKSLALIRILLTT